jgi:phenazine biosynthesis protein phzE
MLLQRPSVSGQQVEILCGEISTAERLADLPLPSHGEPRAHELVALVPYRQIAERGFACQDDGAPLLAMAVRATGTVDVSEAVRRIPDRPINLTDAGFDMDDDDYADTVRRIITQEIGQGEGANFVIRRSFRGTVTGCSTDAALTLFRRLLERETGAYWTFCLHTGNRTLVGASPERHVSVVDGTVMMNPISGTYRYPPSGSTVAEVLDFLADRKEIDELYMVVDEELKMMARLCDAGVRVTGPFLKEMTRLAHTEYLLTGRSSRDPREILRESMFVPTVTGSPLENACRVIKRYEPGGRGYYSGVLALIGRDHAGVRTLDSSVLIRTADIAEGGPLEIGVGATLVRHSDPASEAAETRAKTAALLTALRSGSPMSMTPVRAARMIAEHPEVNRKLASRNRRLARFWLDPQDAQGRRLDILAGRRTLVIDGEDTFTAMLEHQLTALGLTVTIRGFDDRADLDEFDFVVIGPGPGDPRDDGTGKIATLRATTHVLLAQRKPFLAICLGHQILSGVLGLSVIRKRVPNQGLQQEIDLFGRSTRVGFYNTFAAVSTADCITSSRAPGEVITVSRDPGSNEVHALRGSHFCSLQFHPESLLTEHGIDILGDLLESLPATCPAQAGQVVAHSSGIGVLP